MAFVLNIEATNIMAQEKKEYTKRLMVEELAEERSQYLIVLDVYFWFISVVWMCLKVFSYFIVGIWSFFYLNYFANVTC